MSGNTFYGRIAGFAPSQYPDNIYFGGTRPTGSTTVVRPNQYQRGRGHIVVYNWDLDETVAVDVSQVLDVGMTFELRNAQNYFEVVRSGVYDGSRLVISPSDTRIADP